MSVAFVLVGTGTFYGLQHYLRSNLRDTLRRRSDQVTEILIQAPSSTTDAAIARDIETRLDPKFNNRFVRVTRAPDDLIYRSGPPSDHSFDPLNVDQRIAPWANGWKMPATAIVGDLHLMITALPLTTASGHYLIEVGGSTVPVEAVLERLLDLLGLLLPLLIACAAWGGYLLVSRALRPVDRLSHMAEQMSLQNLGLRLPVVPTGDALERLSISLNNMLGRLRDSVQASCASASAAYWKKWPVSSTWSPDYWCCRVSMPGKPSGTGWMWTWRSWCEAPPSRCA